MDKISIIVPIYKVSERYLRKCIESLLLQTYQNLEIILVDDGSPDQSGMICDEYKAKDERIVVIHKDNGGVSEARNQGIACATGKWIAFVDSDDWIERNTFETLTEYINQNVDLIVWNLYLNKGHNEEKLNSYDSNMVIYDGEQIKKMGLCLLRTLPVKEDIWIPTFNRYCVCHLYKREIIRDGNLYFDKDIKQGEDRLFNYSYHMLINSLAYVNSYLYHYRIHTCSATNTFYPENLENSSRVNRRYYELDRKIQEKSEYKDAYNVRVAHVVLMMIEKFFLHPDNDIKKPLKEFKRFIKDKPYSTSVRELKIANLNSIVTKIKLILLKYHFYRCLFLSCKIHQKIKSRKEH